MGGSSFRPTEVERVVVVTNVSLSHLGVGVERRLLRKSHVLVFEWDYNRFITEGGGDVRYLSPYTVSYPIRFLFLFVGLFLVVRNLLWLSSFFVRI